MNDELNNRLQEIKNEDSIFGIFVILIILSYVANEFEKRYFIRKDDNDKYIYYYLQSFIFSVIVIINLYYVFLSYNDVRSFLLKKDSKDKNYAILTFVSSLFALVAGIIILYVVISDTEIDAEISL